MPVIIGKKDLQPLTREHFAQGPLIGCIQSYNAFEEGEEIVVHADLHTQGVTFDIGRMGLHQDLRKYCLHGAFKKVHRMRGELAWIQVSLTGEELLIEEVSLAKNYAVIGEIGRFPL